MRDRDNLTILIPRHKRDLVSFYFELDVVGEEYANLLGEITDKIADVMIDEDDKGIGTVISPILRAGKSISDRLVKRLPDAEVVEICMRRNIHTLKPMVAWDDFSKIQNKEEKRLIITDPALATGGSLVQAIELATQNGFNEKDIIILSMFACESGLENVFSKYPMIKIFLAHLADGIREDGYLLPYNGDTGDRLYGIRDNEFVF